MTNEVLKFKDLEYGKTYLKVMPDYVYSFSKFAHDYYEVHVHSKDDHTKILSPNLRYTYAEAYRLNEALEARWGVPFET